MPPKRNPNRSKNKKQHENQSNAMADCVIPEDIMLSILTRLPVKSLLCFKSVCKPWLELFATPNFIKLHYRQFSDDPENQNFMIYSLSKTNGAHTMSLFRIMSDEKNPTDLDHPYPVILSKMDFVGCYNGLICMGCPPLGQAIVLWNPAIKLGKSVRLSKVEFGNSELVSLGFGYNEEEDDFKVVRIVCLRGLNMKVAAEVYSVKADSWKTIKIRGLQFRVECSRNDAIVGGDPYWIAKVDKNVSDKSHIVWFDVKKMVFKIVPSSNLELGENKFGTSVLPLMDWKGSLATILNDPNREGNGSMLLLVFDKVEKKWNMGHLFEGIPMQIYRCLQCSKSGKIIALSFNGKLFVYDPKSGVVKVTKVEGAEMVTFQIFEYSESLVRIDGMVPVKEGDEAGPSMAHLPKIDLVDLPEIMRYLQIPRAGN